MDVSSPNLDRDEALALFRATVIGGLATRELSHGELAAELRALSKKRFRAPGAKVTRRFSVPTLQRWLYRYRAEGLDGLRPRRRSDAGRAKALTDEQRQLLCDIRAEHPSASVPLVLRTLELAGVFPKSLVSAQTVRRLFRQSGLIRATRRSRDGDLEEIRQRLRWQAPHVGSLWHGDVCHAMKLVKLGSGKTTPVLVHAMLDDHSRFIVRLEVRATECEQDMLEAFANAVREHGVPDRLYLDNGATYSGGILPLVCERLGIHLLHARPGDAPARGKMERVFRTMREQCLDHIRSPGALHDVLVRLLAWREQYHQTPHSSLLGKTPGQVWHDGLRDPERPQRTPLTEEKLTNAYRFRTTRRVRKDSTLSVDGTAYEVDAAWLAGKTVQLERSYLVPSELCVVFEGQRFALYPADPVKNASRRREAPKVPSYPTTTNFRPADVALDHMLGRTPERGEDR